MHYEIQVDDAKMKIEEREKTMLHVHRNSVVKF